MLRLQENYFRTVYSISSVPWYVCLWSTAASDVKHIDITTESSHSHPYIVQEVDIAEMWHGSD